MNRAGQPPQRPPSLAPTPGLGGPFRAPYPAYGMPPRNVMQGYPGLPTHRTAQNMVPQPSPGFIQPRGQGAFPFAGLQPQQSQPHQPTALQQAQQQHQQQQQAHAQSQSAATSTSNLSSHLPPAAATPALTSAQSVSSTSDVGLDPNDFPALGSAPASAAANGNSTATASYASQAGVSLGGAGGAGGGQATSVNGAPTRDFTADDFPALGGQSGQAGAAASTQVPPTQTPGAQQGQQSQSDAHHPPGLNGFGDRLSGMGPPGVPPPQQQQQTPGLLNLTQAQARSAQAGLLSEAEKQRNFALKSSQQSSQAWSSSSPNPGSLTSAGFPSSAPGLAANGALSHLQQQSAQTSNSLPQHLGPPPGVSAPSQYAQHLPPTQQQPQQQQQLSPYAQAGNNNGNGINDLVFGGHPNANTASLHPTPQHRGGLPQTAAQQVLMSPADRWGLLGLIAAIKNADRDASLLAVGTDLGTMGLDMSSENLYSTFITPWTDSAAAHSVVPDFNLPPCYSVAPPPPGPLKVVAFNDETLFYMFYSHPRDALQEVAAHELYNRNWRFHRDLHVWLTKESTTIKVAGGDLGTYAYWDPDSWQKERKDMTVLLSDLEERTSTFPPSLVLQMPPPSSQQGGLPQRAFGVAMTAM